MLFDEEESERRLKKGAEKLGEVERRWAKVIAKWLRMRLESEGVSRDELELLDEASTREIPQVMRTLTEKWQEKGVQQGLQQGKVAAKQEAVLQVLRAKFRRVPARIRKRIEGQKTFKVLEGWLREAALCESLAEFEEKLEEIASGRS